MPVASDVDFFCLPCSGVLVGVYVIFLAVVAMMSDKVQLTKNKVLQGVWLDLVGVLSVLLAVGIIAWSIYRLQLLGNWEWSELG